MKVSREILDDQHPRHYHSHSFDGRRLISESIHVFWKRLRELSRVVYELPFDPAGLIKDLCIASPYHGCFSVGAP